MTAFTKEQSSARLLRLREVGQSEAWAHQAHQAGVDGEGSDDGW
jgi:hypothetical protein